MVPTDLNIGFQGLALIQGQIYNPEKPSGNLDFGVPFVLLFLISFFFRIRIGDTTVDAVYNVMQ